MPLVTNLTFVQFWNKTQKKVWLQANGSDNPQYEA